MGKEMQGNRENGGNALEKRFIMSHEPFFHINYDGPA
jgi:hypothetical protein